MISLISASQGFSPLSYGVTQILYTTNLGQMLCAASEIDFPNLLCVDKVWIIQINLVGLLILIIEIKRNGVQIKHNGRFGQLTLSHIRQICTRQL